ncbi:MAG: 2,3-bisphosphoglycerate-independent phosphoglycerate mutase, partial [Ignavibacteriae bacterium]|nr:2,3-bisphosphoglycerate-independent phosphoglycerate mutase [Ignavibacteriota bacterium]
MALKLEKLKNFTPRKGPVLLVIMDGVGFGKQDESDGVFLAKTPNLDKLLKLPNTTRLKAHGTAVGLPTDDDMGNSEVGHNALGAGRVFDQGAKLVDKSISTGEIFESANWNKIIEHGKTGGTVHLLGLLSDGNVHSHIKQLFTLINKCAESGVAKLRVHALLDGRDVPGRSAPTYITPTEELLKKISEEKGYDYNFGSGGGRMITTMDRYDADWDIVKRGWDAHVLGIGRKFKSATEAIETYYAESEKIDQYLDPFVIVDENEKPIGTIEDGDAVLMFNFRGDRAIEISKA